MNTEEYIKKLEEENEALKNKLKSYTAPPRSKIYFFFVKYINVYYFYSCV